MLCLQCAKLVILNTNRVCLKCQGVVLNNISSICDRCSLEQSICSACLKKIHLVNGNITIPIKRGCKACGK